MSNNTVSKSQQGQNNKVTTEQNKVEKPKVEISAYDRQKFERMTKLWELYNKKEIKEDAEILAGPMDLIREFGQFLVELSTKEETIGLNNLNTNQNMEYTLQIDDVVTVQEPKSVDLEKLEHLAERILTSLPTSETPEVQIKVADNILPDTNITIKHVDGVLSVQIDSNNADAITLLGHQGAALQQLLESKMGESVVVELNSERVEPREDSDERQKEEQKRQNNEDNSDIG